MTAEPPQSPITEAVRSLEVRWIFPGQLETAVAGRFGRFPAAVESARTPTPFLAPRHTVEGLQTSSDLARPAGFEPATRCLEDTFERSRDVAWRRPTSRLTAVTVARCRRASRGVCLHWLPYCSPKSSYLR